MDDSETVTYMPTCMCLDHFEFCLCGSQQSVCCCRDNSGKLVLGDILTGINGKAIKLQKDLFAALDDLKPGDRVDLDIVREGKQEQVAVTLGERADPSATATAAIGPD